MISQVSLVGKLMDSFNCVIPMLYLDRFCRFAVFGSLNLFKQKNRVRFKISTPLHAETPKGKKKRFLSYCAYIWICSFDFFFLISLYLNFYLISHGGQGILTSTNSLYDLIAADTISLGFSAFDLRSILLDALVAAIYWEILIFLNVVLSSTAFPNRI